MDAPEAARVCRSFCVWAELASDRQIVLNPVLCVLHHVDDEVLLISLDLVVRIRRVSALDVGEWPRDPDHARVV